MKKSKQKLQAGAMLIVSSLPRLRTVESLCEAAGEGVGRLMESVRSRKIQVAPLPEKFRATPVVSAGLRGTGDYA